MAYIGIQPAEKFTSFATQEFSTSATTSYTLDHAVANENELALFVNNVRQQPGSGKAYTATGTALTLSAATASTDTMYCVFLGRALQTVVPATNSITAAMVGNDLISGKDALASEPADTDEFLVSDAGTLKRIDYSLIKGGGKVLQVVTDDHATRFVTSSTSYVAATGYSIVITPSATSSKIFLINSGGGADSESSTRIIYGTYYRTISGGSATHIVGDAEGISQVYNEGDRNQAPLNMSFLDSPNTTSEITYQIYIKSNGGQVSYNNNEGKAQFTAFEIAG